VGLNELAETEHHGRPAVRKRYSFENTRRYKIFGSGARHEHLLHPRLGDLVPEELAASTGDGYEEVLLERRPGTFCQPQEVGRDRARSAGRALARIHSRRGDGYGSIDGAHRFERQRDAYAPRWAHALAVLSGPHPELALAVERWGEPRLAELDWAPPTLVHGDFGPLNLLWAGDEVESVLDWEFARYGDPREDWAVADPGQGRYDFKSFRGDVVDALREGYLAAGGSAAATEPVELYRAYYAAVLGTVMPDPGRIAWLEERAG
jgi:hypothetical protein